jgi:hypothetical protein
MQVGSELLSYYKTDWFALVAMLSVDILFFFFFLSPNPNLTSKKAGNLPPRDLKKKLSSPAPWNHLSLVPKLLSLPL